MVGAESTVCPRCGVNFQTALIRKIVLRTLAVIMLGWFLGHYALKWL
jgi:hypothetical protein